VPGRSFTKMSKKLVPGAPSGELAEHQEERRLPSEKAHPVSLRDRVASLRGATEFPGLRTLGHAASLSASPTAFPNVPSLGSRRPLKMDPGMANTELPALGELATAQAQESFAQDSEKPRKTGTTTVGVVTKDACVLATDHRATAGRLVSHTDTQKLFMIDRHLGMTIAGLVGDAQELVRIATSEAKLYSMKHDRPMAVRAAAGVMANLLNQRKFAPFEVALLMGGVDRTGPHLFSLDEAGGSIPDKWCTTGSGSPFVYGVLEDQYKDGLTTSDAIDLCIRGLNASTRRDSASGNGFDVATITLKDGFVWVPREETDRRLKKMGLPPIPK
jgi:proteasome beta subunit